MEEEEAKIIIRPWSRQWKTKRQTNPNDEASLTNARQSHLHRRLCWNRIIPWSNRDNRIDWNRRIKMNENVHNVSESSDSKPKTSRKHQKDIPDHLLSIIIPYMQELTLKLIRKIGNGRSHGQIAIFWFSFLTNLKWWFGPCVILHYKRFVSVFLCCEQNFNPRNDDWLILIIPHCSVLLIENQLLFYHFWMGWFAELKLSPK